MKDTPHTRKYSKEQIEEMLNSGKTPKEIYTELNIDDNAFYYLLKFYNITRIDKSCILKKNDTFFDNIDSEIKSYLLGFLLADGSVLIEPKRKNGIVYSYSKRISIFNSIDDLEILQLYQKFICPNNTIKFSNCQIGVKTKRKDQCGIKWTSTYMVDKLISYGISPRKTYNLDFTMDFSIFKNNDLIFHFLRGFFDGDGCISVSKRSYIKIGFVGTSQPFMNQLINFYKQYNLHFSINSHQCKNMRCYELYLKGGKLAILKFQKLMYNNSNFYLQRKLDKFIYDNTELNIESNKSMSV